MRADGNYNNSEKKKNILKKSTFRLKSSRSVEVILLEITVRHAEEKIFFKPKYNSLSN